VLICGQSADFNLHFFHVVEASPPSPSGKNS
jgi:hypothetical protein